MNERVLIGDMQPGMKLDQVFLIKDRQLRETRTGSMYLHCVLMDKSGEAPGRLWNAPADMNERVKSQDFVHVVGRSELYKDNLQIIVEQIETIDDTQVNVDDFLPAGPLDVEDLFEKLCKAIESVHDPAIRQLLAEIFGDDQTAEKVKRAPAAVSYHQPYLGGLLEHTISVLKSAFLLMQHYRGLNRDLVIAGCLLHDIGKINELEYSRTIRYSDYGELVGHLVDGVLIVERAAAKVEDFPSDILNMIRHIILSHHGEREWGSPILPKFPEAIFIHYLDNLDAKVEASSRAIAEDIDPASNWTQYSRMFERRFYKGVPHPEPEAPPEAPTETE